MGDVERRKSRPDEHEAAAKERQSVTYQLDWVTNFLREIPSLVKKFEEVAKTVGYLSPRILRERRRRRERMWRKEFADTIIEAVRLVINFRMLRSSKGKARLSTSSISEGEEARENKG
jgi:hypothetical protein